MQFTTEIRGQQTEIKLEDKIELGVPQIAWIGQKKVEFELVSEPSGALLRIQSKRYRITDIEWEGQVIQFRIFGQTFSVKVQDERDRLLEKLGFSTVKTTADGILKAPMPGKVLSILANVGDEIEQDQPIVILEAMKMENELKSPVSGVIETIYTQTGDSVEKNQPILEITTRG